MKFYIIGHFDMDNIEVTASAYSKVDNELTRNGQDVTNLCKQKLPIANESEMTKKRLAMVCDSDAVYVLPNWEEDRVAQLELLVANRLNLHIALHPEAAIPSRVTTYINFHAIVKKLGELNVGNPDYPDFHNH